MINSPVTHSEDEQWAPVSDLMAVLMLIFMFIAVIFVRTLVVPADVAAEAADETEFVVIPDGNDPRTTTFVRMSSAPETVHEPANTTIVSVAVSYPIEPRTTRFVRTHDAQEAGEHAPNFQEQCDKIYRVLKTEFEHDFYVWQVDLLKDLTIRFRNPEVLFASGSAELRPRFEGILTAFFPRYLRVIDSHKDDIVEIRIEGHTSSEWDGVDDEADAYFLNMHLSQDRTRNVLEYALRLPVTVAHSEWLRPRITANGLSSSRLILRSDGSEDAERSRRVEFRLLTSSCRKAGGYDEN